MRGTNLSSLRRESLRFALTAIAAMHLAPPLFSAPTLFQSKLTASDAQSLSQFGESVAMDDTYAVVGAHAYVNTPPLRMGGAYLFNATAGTEIRKMVGNDTAPGDEFGISVGISNGVAIVGAHADGEVGSGIYRGSAYLFDVVTGEQRKLISSDGNGFGGHFGYGVAISGNRALVGAYADDVGVVDSGSAYLFDVSTGYQIAKWSAVGAGAADWFGVSVAMQGNRAVIGAPKDNNGGGPGAAYVFDVDTGTQLFKLTATDGAAGDRFGIDVALSGNIAIVGARDDSIPGTSKAGSAYLFNIQTGQQIAKLTASDPQSSSWFGWAVGISGNTAIVGAPHQDYLGSDAGAAYMFDATTGNQIAKLTAPDGTSDDNFGWSVAIQNERAIIGSHWEGGPFYASGAAYLYVPEPAGATLLLPILPSLLALRRRRAALRSRALWSLPGLTSASSIFRVNQSLTQQKKQRVFLGRVLC